MENESPNQQDLALDNESITQLGGESDSNLVKALNSERKERRDLEKKLKELQKTYEGIEPEKYNDLLQKETERQLTETETKKEFEKTVALQKKEIANLKSQIADSQSSYQELEKRSALQRAYFRSHGKDVNDPLTGGSYFDVFYQQFANRFQLESDGSFTVLNDSGTPAYDAQNGANVTVDDYINTIKSDPFYGRMFEAETIRSGTGTTVNGNGTSNNRPSFEEKMGWKK